MSSNVRVLDENELRTVAQSDPLANRLRSFGDDLRHAKALTADLTTVLKRMDDEAACRRDLHRDRGPTFEMPKLTAQEAAKLPPIR
jgi:hypothetical protein